MKRKEFIRLSALAGTGLLLGACGPGDDSKKTPEARRPGRATEAQTVTHSSPAPPTLIGKGDPRYNDLRKGFNTRIDKYPLAIALCENAREVASAVRYGHEKRLAIAVKSGGHSVDGLSCNEGGLVVNLSKMNKVEVREDNKISVGPGCTLGQLYDFILPHNLLLPGGSCATVGLGGLTLGGGYGLFSRKYGLTCDHLEEAVMVDGNGTIVRASEDPELMWALKGGGNGNFGIVTELIFRTHAAPPALQAHYFKSHKLTAAKAAAILQVWMDASKHLPQACFSGFVLSGSTLNILVTNYEPENKQVNTCLKTLAAVTDDFRSGKANKLSTMLRNYYGSSKPLYFRISSAGLFNSYSDIAGVVQQVMERTIGTPGMIYQVNTFGGAIQNSSFEKASSFPHRGYDFISELQCYSPAKGGAEATTAILKMLEEHGLTRHYVNYGSLEFSHWEQSYYAENYSRLQPIKRKYDPDNNIRHAQSVRL